VRGRKAKSEKRKAKSEKRKAKSEKRKARKPKRKGQRRDAEGAEVRGAEDTEIGEEERRREIAHP
jgi:hypothetical protein